MGSWNERPNAELQGRMSGVVALAVLAAWPRGGTLSAAWHRHVFNHCPWLGPQTVLHKFFCGASLKAKWALNKKRLKKQSWKVWSIYVKTSWTTVVVFFSSSEYFFALKWRSAKGFAEFGCVVPNTFMLIHRLTWLSLFLSILRTQSNNNKSK